MSESIFKTLHAIQLEAIETRELFIRLNGEISEDFEDAFKEAIKLGSAHSDFDEENKIIHIGLRLTIGMEKDTDSPLSMRIEIVGTFSVNTDEFPENMIEDWAKKNAPLILYPFAREHCFALTTRCGLPQAILPLLQVPTITSQAID